MERTHDSSEQRFAICDACASPAVDYKLTADTNERTAYVCAEHFARVIATFGWNGRIDDYAASWEKLS